MNPLEPAWRKQKSIPSSSRHAVDLIRELLDQLELSQWTNRQIFGIHLAMEEALMNAIKHGNLNDESKTVCVEIELTKEQFQAKITDEGEGFCLEDVPDPTEDVNLELPSGRGVAMIKNFVDQAIYNPTGNSVTLMARRKTKPAD
ncbi:MAG: ATP-binding protein [Mariniblastus sp.]|nr:ATP-binding protein [Mariniblastus sp.]